MVLRASARRRSRSGSPRALEPDDCDPAHAPQPRASSPPATSTCRGSSASSSARTAASRKGRDRTFHFGRLEKRIVGMISHLGAMLPGGRRPRPGRAAPGRDAGGRGLHRRRRHERGRLPRGAEPGRGVEAAGAVRHREQPVRPLDARPRAVRLPRPGRPRRSATACRASSWTATTCWRCTARCARAAERARARRRADPARVQDLPDARPRGGLGHRLRAQASWSRSGRAKDPVARFEALLLERGRARRRRARPRCAPPTRPAIDALVDEALAAPEPASDRRGDAGRRVRAEPARGRRLRAARPPRRRPELRYVDAISDGLREAMRRDDAGRPAGPGHRRVRRRLQGDRGLRRGVRQGARAQHADHRVGRDRAPPSASPSTASVPMVEMQFGDFITCGFNQIVNNLAKTHYRWGARGAGGDPRARWAAAPGRGRSTRRTSESWFTSVAGLKVVAPATPYDAKGLLLAAFEDGNPVLYLEHKLLYRSARGRVPDGPLHGADRRGAGGARGPRRDRRHLRRRRLVGARGGGASCAAEGREIEVDRPALAAALGRRDGAGARCARPGRALVLHEAPLTGGFGGEIAATIGERGLRVARRAGGAAGRARHAGALRARRSRRSSRRRAGCCPRCATCSPTDAGRALLDHPDRGP